MHALHGLDPIVRYLTRSPGNCKQRGVNKTGAVLRPLPGLVGPRVVLERDLRAHADRIEPGAGVGGAGGAGLPGDVAMQVVEHEPDVAVDVPVQARGVDGLAAAGDAVDAA